MKRLTYTIEEAARVLGIGRSSAYQAARTGEIPVVRIGRRLLVPVGALESMLADWSNHPASQRLPDQSERPSSPSTLKR